MNDPVQIVGALRRPFLEALDAGELVIQRCDECGFHPRLPRSACTQCGARALRWVRSAGTGVVHAVTVVSRAPSKALQARTPYTLVLVDLDEGARVMGHGWAGARIGDAVRLRIEPAEPRPLLHFEPR